MIIPTDYLCLHPEVKEAFDSNRPVLAMESTILSHGMPYPDNIAFAIEAEGLARSLGVVPATIGILNGIVHVGMANDQLEHLGKGPALKTSLRDISFVLSRGYHGATTVSATMAIAHVVGIHVFSTGGIGGVHRGAEQTLDISQDVDALSRFPVLVVSAGAKSILDIPKTLEALESASVPVLGYGTDMFPGFYTRSSGETISTRFDSLDEISDFFHTHRRLGMSQGVLVANPVPESHALSRRLIDRIVDAAIEECNRQGIRGKEITPFLLSEIVRQTDGKSLAANISLAKNNVAVGAKIALRLASQ